MGTKNNWPFSKIQGSNGELFHMGEKPLFARVENGPVVALHDSVEYQREDSEGNMLSELGKVLNLFFLESTEKIVAQIERAEDKKIMALDISGILRNFNNTEGALPELEGQY